MRREKYNELESKVEATINKFGLFSQNDTIVVGVSGGPDSICLLDILNKNKEKWQIHLVVAHVNHMLRKKSKVETEYVKAFCEKRNIPCHVLEKDVASMAKERKLGLEETGRQVRYAFFEAIANQVETSKIATAHNLNDKVETVILNIIRGSGMQGLKGMDVKREEKGLVYMKPLLEVQRSEIETYCLEQKLEPKIDESNQSLEYNRNKIRNVVIPYLEKEFNPNITNTLNRLSEITSKEDAFLQSYVEEIYEQIKQGETKDVIKLDLKQFNEQAEVIKKRLLLHTYQLLFGTTEGLEKIHLEDMIKLCQNNIGNKYLSPQTGSQIWVKNKQVIFLKKAKC